MYTITFHDVIKNILQMELKERVILTCFKVIYIVLEEFETRNLRQISILNIQSGSKAPRYLWCLAWFLFLIYPETKTHEMELSRFRVDLTTRAILCLDSLKDLVRCWPVSKLNLDPVKLPVNINHHNSTTCQLITYHFFCRDLTSLSS